MTRKPHGAAALWAALLLLMTFANVFALLSFGYHCEHESPSEDSALGRVCAWDDPEDGRITMTPVAIALIPLWLILVGGPLALLTGSRRLIATALFGPYSLLFVAWVALQVLPSG